MTGLYTGQALGGFGATLAASKGWHTAFHWFGIVGICYALLLAILLMEKKHTSSDEESTSESQLPLSKSLLLLFSNVAFWILLFYFAAPSLPGWAIKNWLPTLFADSLNIPMANAGPLSTITIAISSFIGVIAGGILSDRWAQKHIRGRIYTSAIGLGLTIPALLFLGLGQTLLAVVGAAVCFGIGFGIFDANNMPILCQVVPKNLRATAYGFMNMVGVFAGAVITQWLGKFKDEGHFGLGFALLGAAVLLALLLQLLFLKPKTMEK